MTEPSHPTLKVRLAGQESKPLAMIARVRQTLQGAGQVDAAMRFTDEALAAGPDEVLDIARRYVRVL